MTELEKIAYAKSFIDKLANGINPLDDKPIPEGDIANNVRLSRCFFYVSDILDKCMKTGELVRLIKQFLFQSHQANLPVLNFLRIRFQEVKYLKN